MQAEEFLFLSNEFLVIGTLLGVLLGATEVGFRLGRAFRPRMEDPAKSHYWSLQAGVMGLLALLLAFTFSMAISRYETRRQLLIDETNAIASLYLCSRILPEPNKGQVEKIVDGYVACRLQDYSMVLNEDQAAAANRTCAGLQNQLRAQAEAVIAKNPAWVPAGMFVSHLMQVSEVSAKRDAARENHVPEPVLIFLFVVAMLTVGLLGYGCGLGNHRHLAATITVCVLVSLVILVIMDLDEPRRGLIRISQSPMVDLLSNLQ